MKWRRRMHRRHARRTRWYPWKLRFLTFRADQVIVTIGGIEIKPFKEGDFQCP